MAALSLSGISAVGSARDLGSRGREFEPPISDHRVHPAILFTSFRPAPQRDICGYIGASPSGKARDFDSLIRWFESSRPSHRGVVDPGIVSFHARRRSGKSAATRWISSEAERMFRKHQVGISEFPSSSRGESLNAGWSPRDVVGSTYPGATAAFRGEPFYVQMLLEVTYPACLPPSL